jgi:hypothetical protein
VATIGRGEIAQFIFCTTLPPEELKDAMIYTLIGHHGAPYLPDAQTFKGQCTISNKREAVNNASIAMLSIVAVSCLVLFLASEFGIL